MHGIVAFASVAAIQHHLDTKGPIPLTLEDSESWVDDDHTILSLSSGEEWDIKDKGLPFMSLLQHPRLLVSELRGFPGLKVTDDDLPPDGKFAGYAWEAHLDVEDDHIISIRQAWYNPQMVADFGSPEAVDMFCENISRTNHGDCDHIYYRWSMEEVETIHPTRGCACPKCRDNGSIDNLDDPPEDDEDDPNVA